MFNLWIVLAILGAAAVGVSMTVIHSSTAAMLGIVFGGVLLQASIILFALNFGREKPRPRRRRYERRYEMGTAA
ncbi:MAG: hypothetical protein AB7H90_21915 [Alphaproteobacteria bacterium]